MGINWSEAFNRLFEIINAGGDRQAPHYYSGTRFLRALNKVDYSIPGNYMAYIESRREKGLSTTRGNIL